MRGDVVLLALFGPEWANASVSARLSALVDRHGKRGLWVVGALKRDDVRELRDLACRDGAKFSVVRDPKDELRRTYLKEARFAGPTLVVIDRDGIVRMVAHGAERLDAIEAALKDALRDRNGVELD
jgi:peroxiredoxin